MTDIIFNTKFRIVFVVMLMIGVCTTVSADNPLRIGATSPSHAAPQVDSEPIELIPAEVQQVTTAPHKPQTEIRFDHAVQPATHVAPFKVRSVPVREVTSQLKMDYAETSEPKSGRANLALVGRALEKIQSAPAIDPVTVPSTVWHDETSQQSQRWNDSDVSSELVESLADEPVIKTEQTTPIRSETSGASATSPEFRKVIERIALSTCLVLCGGVGFILVAKQFMKPKKPVKAVAAESIQIRSTLQLSPKSHLFLVEVGTHKLMVASDQNGIRSVVPLTDTFSQTLKSFEQDEATAATFSMTTPAVETTTPAVDAGKLPPEMYSLATVGQRAARTANESTNRPPQRSAAKTETDIRRTMEDALRDRGLKDLLMQSLQAKAA